MSFPYSSEGIEANQGYEALLPGEYVLKIENAEERITKNGDPMVVVDYVVAGGPQTGRKIRFHNVVFLGKDETGKAKKGSGMAIHYLKTIGEPFEGEFIVDPPVWLGKKLLAVLGQEKGTDGIVRNNVRFVKSIMGQQQKEDEVPF